MEQIKDEELKKLIRKGYKLELISFEFDVPLDHLKELKAHMENTNKKQQEGIYSNVKKVRKMRERYVILLNSSQNNNQENKKTYQTDEQGKIIDEALIKIEENINSINEKTEIKEKAQYLKSIVRDVKEISEYPFTFEQSQKMYQLFNNKELKKLENINVIREILSKINNIIGYKLSKCFNEKIDDTKDMEGLIKIKQLILKDRLGINIQYTIARIDRKIQNLQQNKAIANIKDNISQSIIDLANRIANSNITKEEAEKIIIEESEKIKVPNVNSKFGLTPKQQNKQILREVKYCLIENATNYPIKNSEETIKLLQELGEDANVSIRTVVKNLIERKEFASAEELCNKYLKVNEPYIRILQREIESEKLKTIALKILSGEGSIEEDLINYDKISKSKINLSNILIGTSKDGSKKITLTDLVEERKVKNLSR